MLESANNSETYQKIQNAFSLDECTEPGVLYEVSNSVGNKFFAATYLDKGYHFVVALQKLGSGEYSGILFTQEGGFADVPGANLFIYARNLRRVVNTILQKGVQINTLNFTHMEDSISINEIEVIKGYLVRNDLGLFTGMYSADEYREEFIRYAKKDKELTGEEKGLLKKFKKEDSDRDTDGRRKFLEEARMKRYKIFFPITKRAFRGLDVEFDVSNKPDFTVTFK